MLLFCFKAPPPNKVVFPLNIHINIVQVRTQWSDTSWQDTVPSTATTSQLFTLSSLAYTLRGVSSIDYPFTKSKKQLLFMKLLACFTNIYRNIYRKCHVWNEIFTTEVSSYGFNVIKKFKLCIINLLHMFKLMFSLKTDIFSEKGYYV